MVTVLYIGIIIILIVVGGLLASIRGELEVLKLYCKCLEHKIDYLLNKEDIVVIPDEWKISPEKAEKIYYTAQENMRGYQKE